MSRGRFYNPQFDLFLPTIVDLKFRDQKDTMERPFFSLSKSKRMKPIEYINENDGIFVTVQPHQDCPPASISWVEEGSYRFTRKQYPVKTRKKSARLCVIKEYQNLHPLPQIHLPHPSCRAKIRLNNWKILRTGSAKPSRRNRQAPCSCRWKTEATLS